MELKNWILLILLGAVWGSAFMFIKISADDFGPILLVNLRLLLAGALVPTVSSCRRNTWLILNLIFLAF